MELVDIRDFIDNWTGEIWGCNSAYKEYYDLPRLNLLIGDDNAVKEACKFKEENHLQFTIYSKHHIKYYTPDKITLIHLPTDYVNDSGSTLVYKALFENYTEIKLVGFDLGGKDIYVKNHEKKDKTIWAKRWRRINEMFTLNKIEFIGNPEVKDFILSTKDVKLHSKTYLPIYQKRNEKRNIIKNGKTVLILGNGKSRLKYEEFIHNWQGDIWGCNWIFQEVDKFKNITRIGSVHDEVIEKMYVGRQINSQDYSIWTKPNFKSKFTDYPDLCYFSDGRGWSTGNLMILQALTEHYKRIYLCGFDFGGADVYQPYNVEGSNFKKQFKEINNKFGKTKFKFVGSKPTF